MAKKGPEKIVFEIRQYSRPRIRYSDLAYRLLTYKQYFDLAYLVLSSDSKPSKAFLQEFSEYGLGIISVNVQSKEVKMILKANTLHLQQDRNVLAHEMVRSDVKEELGETPQFISHALLHFGDETKLEVRTKFMDSIFSDVLLGGCLVSGIILLSEFLTFQEHRLSLGAVLVLIPIVIWAGRYLSAKK